MVQRAARESGFTLIELLIVLVVIGILSAIAVPAYLGFRDRAADTASQSIIRVAAVAATAYAIDNTGEAGDADSRGHALLPQACGRRPEVGPPVAPSAHLWAGGREPIPGMDFVPRA